MVVPLYPKYTVTHNISVKFSESPPSLPGDCEWEYGEFGPCSVSCGGGTQVGFPVILQSSQFGGRDCPPFVLDGVPNTRSCNTVPCPGKEFVQPLLQSETSLYIATYLSVELVVIFSRYHLKKELFVMMSIKANLSSVEHMERTCLAIKMNARNKRKNLKPPPKLT